jgi:hypothetical protein
MAGKTVVDKIQLGNHATPANNFVISTQNDGTLKIQRGNDGGALTDVLTIDVNGKITSAYDIAAGQLSLTENGYAKLANGLILQWGTVTLAAATTTIAYPIAFPNAILNITATATDNLGGGSECVETGSKTVTNFTSTSINSAGNATASKICWFAIGR